LRRRQDLFIPPVVLDRKAPEALSRQIHHQIASSIANAPANVRLPSTRLLSKLLNVSRNTVLAAYEELTADGLIQGYPGAGMFLCVRSAPIDRKGLSRAIRAAHYPSRTLPVPDPDGNPLYLNF
jgi:GntR family transcriptional regulator/MocR family aminotransferase